jgi:hypothetical protein
VRRLLAKLLGVSACAAVLTSCGAGGSNGATGSRSALLSTLENWSALETPVDQALGILTEKCMVQHGLRYYPFPRAGQPGGSPIFASATFGSSLWLGPQSLAWRIVNGWGLYEDTMQQLSQPGGLSGGQPAEFRLMQTMRGASIQTYVRTLYGGGKTLKIRIPGLPRATIRIGGCNTTAGKQLFGSVAGSVAVPEYGPAILNGSIQPRAARSPAVHVSQASWAACVRAGTGISARSPSQLLLHFYSLYQTKGPTLALHRKELEASITDLRCQRRSRLARAVQQAALAAIAHLPGSVMGELQTLLGVLEQARTRARQVFAHPPTNAGGTSSASGGNGSFQPNVPQAVGPAGGGGQPVVIFGG